MDAAAALASLPSEARGLLTVETQTPLSLYGCEARLRVLGYSAQLTVQLEYVNESNANQAVVAAHAIPLHWQLMECAVHYDGDDRLYTFYDKNLQPTWGTCEAAGGMTTTTAKGSQPALTVYEREACTVAMQPVPWTMRIGSSMVLSATYAIPLTSQHATMPSTLFELALPAPLFPPSSYSPAGVNIEYNALFAHSNNGSGMGRRLAPGLTLHAECDLYSPLRGPVTLARANMDCSECDKGDENKMEDEVLECEVEYVGDSRFVLHYRSVAQDCVALYKAQRHRPFVLRCDVHESNEPLRLFVERDDEEEVKAKARDSPTDNTYAIALALTPSLARCEVNAECVFVLDLHRSGSAASVAAALHLALRALPTTVRVNLVLYDAHDHAMSALYKDGSVPVTSMDLDALQDLVRGLSLPHEDPGTPQGAAVRVRTLHDILHHSGRCGGGPSPEGYVRQVVWISDAGQTAGATVPRVSLLEWLREARTHTTRARVSTIALSFSLCVDEASLRLLAREGGGVFVRAAEAPDVAGALTRVLATCAVPTLSEIRVTFPDYTENNVDGDANAHGASQKKQLLPRSSAISPPATQLHEKEDEEGGYVLPTVAHGSHGCLYLLAPASVKTLTVCVTGRVGSAVLEYTASCEMAHAVMPPTADVNGEKNKKKMLHVAAAAARIASLATRATMSALTRAEVDEMVQLSRRYTLPCPFTQLYQRCSSASAVGPLVGRGTFSLLQQQPFGEGERRVVMSWYNQHGAVCEKEWQTMQQAQLTREARHLRARRVNAPPLAPQLPKPASTAETLAQDVLDTIIDAVVTGPDVARLLQLQDREGGGFALDARLALCLGVREAMLRAQQPVSCTSSALWATVLAMAYMEHVQDDRTLLALRRARQCVTQMMAAGSPASQQQQQQTERDAVVVPWQDWLSSAEALVAAPN